MKNISCITNNKDDAKKKRKQTLQDTESKFMLMDSFLCKAENGA